MHRLQISLPEWQAQYLAERSERDGVSIAEILRRLVARESEPAQERGSDHSLWELAGLAEDPGDLIHDKAVSASPELYLTAEETTAEETTAEETTAEKTAAATNADPVRRSRVQG